MAFGVTAAKLAQLVERWTAELEISGLNPGARIPGSRYCFCLQTVRPSRGLDDHVK